MHLGIDMSAKFLGILVFLNFSTLVLYTAFSNTNLLLGSPKNDSLSNFSNLNGRFDPTRMMNVSDGSDLGTDPVDRQGGSASAPISHHPASNVWPNSCSKKGLDLEKSASRRGLNGRFDQVGSDTYVYEAYFDGRRQNVSYVRIIAVSPLNATVYCHLWYSDSQRPLLVQAEIYVRMYHK